MVLCGVVCCAVNAVNAVGWGGVRCGELHGGVWSGAGVVLCGAVLWWWWCERGVSEV